MKAYKLIKRILFSPFVLGFIFVYSLLKFYEYIRYGGEMTVYDKNAQKTINDIYQQLKNETK